MATSIDERSALQTEVTDANLLDQTVEEVFAMMLGSSVNITESALAPSNTPITLTAVIGLAGALSGAFTLTVSEATSRNIASTMMGMEISELDGDVYDAVGEITNILAGGWKSRIASLHSGCLLSVPTVVTGTNYDVHRKTTNFRITRSYQFGDSPLTINIFGEWPSGS